jgi:hypothetical protein
MINKRIFATTLLAATGLAHAGSWVETPPASPDASARYIFYLHGTAEEQNGSSAKYEAAVEAIAEADAVVISEVRDDSEPNSYARKLADQVNALIAAGVPPRNVTVSGYSKGSVIALAAAGAIANPEVNYVLLAGCAESLNGKYDVDGAKAVGRILSIYDSGDYKFGSCSRIVPGAALQEEIELDSGKGHKLFRIPKEKFIEQWRDPLVDWAGA